MEDKKVPETETVGAEQDPFLKQIEEERAKLLKAAQTVQFIRPSKHQGSKRPKALVKATNRYKNKLARKARKANRRARNR